MSDDTRGSPPERADDSASPQHVGWREILSRAYLPQLLTLCLAIWLHAANSMLTATTLPEAVADIGGLRLISWAFALYLMGSIVAATAISASVASYGLRRTMIVSTLVYTLGSVICAAAPTMPVLLAGRTVQGLGGGALVALVYIAQDRFFPNRMVPRIIACLSVVWTASALCGPLIGGAFATAGLWRFAFWAFALQSLLLAAAVQPLLARTHAAGPLQARPIPLVRLSLVAGAILTISFARHGDLDGARRHARVVGMRVSRSVRRARFRGRAHAPAAESRDRPRTSGRLRHRHDLLSHARLSCMNVGSALPQAVGRSRECGDPEFSAGSPLRTPVRTSDSARMPPMSVTPDRP